MYTYHLLNLSKVLIVKLVHFGKIKLEQMHVGIRRNVISGYA